MPVQMPKHQKNIYFIAQNFFFFFFFFFVTKLIIHVDMEKCKVENLLNSTDDL